MLLERSLNAVLALIITTVLFGALAIQFFKHEIPCPLCLLQRLGMLGVITGSLLNIKYGPRKAHYGLSLFSAVFGGFVALRQVALHVCPQFPKFGVPFWGLSLYTWSFIIFCCTVFYISLMLMFFDHQDHPLKNLKLEWWAKVLFLLVFLVAFINIFSTFWLCGFGACGDV